ncbi:MAG: macro domain-containing protein [Syntrophorhabdales bacterium]|jgi:O-acetyl-ADP-ribose deacetylase (regulator of RNase III)
MVYNSGAAGQGKMEIVKEVVLHATRVRVIRGDLTEAPVDAIVNAANSHLQHGGGVAGAIVRKGGAIIQEESDRIGYVPVGESAVTTAGKLPAKYVIHTVGPRWGEGDEEAKLRSAVRNTLKVAEERGFTRIAMPAISAGIFGFPKDRCAHIILEEITAFVARGRVIEEIDLYLLDPEIIDFFSREIERTVEA